MFPLFVRRFDILYQSGIRILIPSGTLSRFNFVQNPSFRFISTSPKSSPTLDYLTNSCGLSPHSALKASQRIVIDSTTKPDSVVSLLKSYGFTETHISKLISKLPSLLLAKTEILKPKLDFFVSLDISNALLAKLVVRDPSILMRSLEKTIVPSINFLRSLSCSDTDIAFVLNRSTWVVHYSENSMGANIGTLRKHGVPELLISKFVLTNPRTLLMKPDRIEDMVLELKRMGMVSSRSLFMRGLHVISAMRKPLWVKKMEAYRSLGWSEDEILAVFRKNPNFMGASVERVTLALDYFSKNIGWTRADMIKHSTALFLSLEKRVIPRWSVLQMLLSKNFITKPGVAQGLKVPEMRFVRKYVEMYQSEVPDVMKAYQKAMSSQGLKVNLKDHRICRVDKC